MELPIFSISIRTPYLLTILVLKFEIVHSTVRCCVLNIAICMAKSVEHDQMPHSVLFSNACLSPLRKHAYSNVLKILQPKNENFQIKISDIFHISAKNIDCGYALELPC